MWWWFYSSANILILKNHQLSILNRWTTCYELYLNEALQKYHCKFSYKIKHNNRTWFYCWPLRNHLKAKSAEQVCGFGASRNRTSATATPLPAVHMWASHLLQLPEPHCAQLIHRHHPPCRVEILYQDLHYCSILPPFLNIIL